MRFTKSIILVAVCALTLALAAPALAATPAQSAYGGACASHSSLCNGTTLPFTGINAGLVGAIGFVLLGFGLVMRRSSAAGNA